MSGQCGVWGSACIGDKVGSRILGLLDTRADPEPFGRLFHPGVAKRLRIDAVVPICLAVTAQWLALRGYCQKGSVGGVFPCCMTWGSGISGLPAS